MKSNITIHHEDQEWNYQVEEKWKYHNLLDPISAQDIFIYIYIWKWSQIIDVYIYIYIGFSFNFFTTTVSWKVFFQSLLAECIKISTTSSCINIDFGLINVSSIFTNILIYFMKDIKTDCEASVRRLLWFFSFYYLWYLWLTCRIY